MKTVYLAVRMPYDAEFDTIAFASYDEMKEFCRVQTEYYPFETGEYTAKEALEIFGD